MTTESSGIDVRRVVLLGAALCVVGVAFALSFRLTDGGDYANPFCSDRRCGDAAPAINALQRGRVGRFFDEQPAMGPASLVLRAPAAAIARGVGGNEDWQYRAGSIVCVLAAVALALALALLLAARGVRWVGWLPLAALCIVNPANGDALQRGHPEEIFGAALLAGAALAAANRRVGVAGLLLGLALATKQWAWLGVVPVVFLAPAAGRVRVALVALVAVVLLTAPMAIGNFTEFRHATDAAANPPGTVKPLDIWYPFADEHTVTVRGGGVTEKRVVRQLSPSVDDLTHPLVVAIALALMAAWWFRGSRDAAAWLLAALLLVRVLGDPHGHPYHHAPFMLALAVGEALSRRRFPWATLAASGCLALSLRMFDNADWATTNVVYLAWALPALAALAFVSVRRRAA